MTVRYKGMDADYHYRIAEICYSYRDEQELMDELEKVMNDEYGWNLRQIADEYALCRVDSYDEYKEFVSDYKKAKKTAKLRVKLGN